MKRSHFTQTTVQQISRRLAAFALVGLAASSLLSPEKAFSQTRQPGRSTGKSEAARAEVQAKLDRRATNSPLGGGPSNVKAPGYGPGTHFVEFYSHQSHLWLEAKLFIPEGPQKHPAVVVLHGSGGLWSNNNVDQGIMTTHFEDWAQTFLAEGYVSLFIDSYTPRGLVEFKNKRPAEDPALDDAICSPAYERTKDAYAGLAFLQSGWMNYRVHSDRIGLMGFSHGGSTALATVVSTSVQPTEWSVNYLKLDDTTDYDWDTNIPSPQLPPLGSEALGFKAVVAYYPGCGFHGYFGSLQDFVPDRYMPYAPSLIMHGDADVSVNPDTHPTYLVTKSEVHAADVNYVPNINVQNLLNEFEGMTPNATANGSANNPLAHVSFAGAEHSFDETLPGAANLVAKQNAHEMTLRWLETFLQ